MEHPKEVLAPAADVTRHYRLGVLGGYSLRLGCFAVGPTCPYSFNGEPIAVTHQHPLSPKPSEGYFFVWIFFNLLLRPLRFLIFRLYRQAEELIAILRLFKPSREPVIYAINIKRSRIIWVIICGLILVLHQHTAISIIVFHHFPLLSVFLNCTALLAIQLAPECSFPVCI